MELMSGANKATVEDGVSSLENINKNKKVSLEELRKLNTMKIKEMSDWVGKEKQTAAPTKPTESASHEADVQYEVNSKSYAEKKGLLDKFDAQITALKESYMASKEELKGASREELAALEEAIGIPKPEPKAPAAAPTTPAATKEEPKKEAPKAEPAAPKAAEKAPEEKTEYKVNKGDNLTKIAKANGTTVTELAALNKITSKDKMIYVGQVLQLPKKAPAVPPKAPEAPAAKTEKKADGSTEKKADAKADDKTEKTDKTTKPAETVIAPAVAPAHAPAPKATEQQPTAPVTQERQTSSGGAGWAKKDTK